MTREEAIEWINSLVETMIYETHGTFAEPEYRNEVYEALEMAIKALEQNESAEEWYKLFVEKLEQEPSGDAISRQAVLDGLASIAKAKAKSDAQKSLIGRVMFFTEHLPSVNPQEPKTDVLDKIFNEVCDIDDDIVLNHDSVFDRKAYVRLIKVMDIIDKYRNKAEREDV